jgi:hypothetical protein
MNKKGIIIAIVILLLLIVGYFFMTKKGTSPLSSLTNTSTSTSPKSLKDLIGAGSSQKCTFSSKVEDSETSGTVYVASGKMRGDFTSVVSGKTNASHMIVDGTTSYTWMDGEKTGYKMTFDVSQETQTTGTPVSDSTSGSPDIDQSYDYDCSGWAADSSVFVPPADVKFMSFDSILPSSQPSGTGAASGSTSQCSYCDSLSGDSKTQCLSALNCN